MRRSFVCGSALLMVGCALPSVAALILLQNPWPFIGLLIVLGAEFRAALLRTIPAVGGCVLQGVVRLARWLKLERLAHWPLTREQRIRWLLAIVTIGFLINVSWHYMQGMFWGKEWPHNSFLPHPITRFCDFYCAHLAWTRFRFTGVGFGLSYFPSAYLFFEPFCTFGSPYTCVAVYLSVFVAFMAAYAFVNLRTGGVSGTLQAVAVCFMSYPVLFTLHTANFEMTCFACLALFVYAYQRARSPALTGLLLAIPLSMKLFPAVFLVLFVSDRRYREMLWTIAWAVVLSVVPLLLFEGGFDDGLGGYLQRLMASQQMYKELMIIGDAGLHYGHSLLGALRILAGEYFSPMSQVMKPYLAFTLILFGGISFYLIRYERTFWKKIALLVVAMNLLPYTSTDYKLLHLFIPLFLFVNTSHSDRFDALTVTLFGLCLISKDYAYFNGLPLHTLNQVLNPFLMTAIAAVIVIPGLVRGRSQSADQGPTSSQTGGQDLLAMPDSTMPPGPYGLAA